MKMNHIALLMFFVLLGPSSTVWADGVPSPFLAEVTAKNIAGEVSNSIKINFLKHSKLSCRNGMRGRDYLEDGAKSAFESFVSKMRAQPEDFHVLAELLTVHRQKIIEDLMATQDLFSRTAGFLPLPRSGYNPLDADAMLVKLTERLAIIYEQHYLEVLKKSPDVPGFKRVANMLAALSVPVLGVSFAQSIIELRVGNTSGPEFWWMLAQGLLLTTERYWAVAARGAKDLFSLSTWRRVFFPPNLQRVKEEHQFANQLAAGMPKNGFGEAILSDDERSAVLLIDGHTDANPISRRIRVLDWAVNYPLVSRPDAEKFLELVTHTRHSVVRDTAWALFLGRANFLKRSGKLPDEAFTKANAILGIEQVVYAYVKPLQVQNASANSAVENDRYYQEILLLLNIRQKLNSSYAMKFDAIILRCLQTLDQDDVLYADSYQHQASKAINDLLSFSANDSNLSIEVDRWSIRSEQAFINLDQQSAAASITFPTN